MTDDQDDPYTAAHTYEALILTDAIADMWDRQLAECRCAEQYPEIMEAIGMAALAMSAAYTLIGQKLQEEGMTKPLDLEDVTKQ